MSKQYTTDDLLHLANLGRFGSPEMNALAHSAFVHIKVLQDENAKLKNILKKKEEDVSFFGVCGQPTSPSPEAE
jgi:hypothetical protein